MKDVFNEALHWLEALSSEAKFFRLVGEGSKPSPTLDIVNQILDALGRPDISFQYRIVVGGTAGKGTVCRLIEDTLERQGVKTACLMSPHVQVVTERIRIGGEMISEKLFGECVLEIKNLCSREQACLFPTYYEAIILAGILAAYKSGAEVLICEIGMGGRLDAVNAVEGKRISALTFVGEDHLEFFENSIEKLAEEKAGIFTKDSILNLSFEQKYCSILNAVGIEQCSVAVKYIKGINSKLNKKLVRKICEHILGHTDFKMRKVQLPARWEVIAENREQRAENNDIKIILDGAHSRPRFEYILPKIQKIKGPKIGIFAMAKNHDAKAFEIILPFFDEVIWTQVEGERAFWAAEELQKMFEQGQICLFAGKALQVATSVGNRHACSLQNTTILVIGSFYLCGEIRSFFYSSEKILEKRNEFL